MFLFLAQTSSAHPLQCYTLLCYYCFALLPTMLHFALLCPTLTFALGTRTAVASATDPPTFNLCSLVLCFDLCFFFYRGLFWTRGETAKPRFVRCCIFFFAWCPNFGKRNLNCFSRGCQETKKRAGALQRFTSETWKTKKRFSSPNS